MHSEDIIQIEFDLSGYIYSQYIKIHTFLLCVHQTLLTAQTRRKSHVSAWWMPHVHEEILCEMWSLE